MDIQTNQMQLPPLNERWLPASGDWNGFFPVIDMRLYPLIGAVAAFWGSFELRMDELLASFVQADRSHHDAGWQRRNFKKRSALLKDKVAKHFRSPTAISREIDGILAKAAVYQWQRNLVVHGHYRATDAKGLLRFHTEGVLNGKLAKLPITFDFLEQLYHELFMLTGRLIWCTDPASDPHALSSHDRSLLRDFVLKHPPNLPTPQILAPQLPPSPG